MAAALRNLKLLNSIEFFSKFVLFQGILAVYYASVTGSYVEAMLVFSLVFLSAAVFELPTGIFSDYIGRRNTVILYALANACGMYLYFAANDITLLLVGALFEGLAVALRSGTISAYVYESAEALGTVDFSKHEGSRRSYGYWGEVVSGLLGAAVVFLFDMRMAVLLTALVFILVIIISIFLTEPDRTAPNKGNIYSDLKNAWRQFINDPELRNFSIAKTLSRGAGNVEYRFRALLFATVMPVWLVNVLGVVSDLATGLALKYAHSITRRIGVMASLVHLEIFDRIATAILAIINTASSLFAMNIITSVVYGIKDIAADDALQARYAKEQRATMGSIVGLASSLLYSALGIAIGMLADYVGLINTMLIMQVIMGSAAVFFFLALRSNGVQSSTKV